MSASRGSTSDILKGLQSPAAAVFDFREAPQEEPSPDLDFGFTFIEKPAPELQETPGAPSEPYLDLVIDEYMPTKPSVVGYEVAHRPMSPELPQVRKYAGQSASERMLTTAGSTVYSQTAQSTPNLTEQPVPAWMAARQKDLDSKTTPSKHRDIKHLGEFTKPSDIKSFHKVSTYINAEAQPTVFLKHIPISSTSSTLTASKMTPEQIMTELEPMAVAFFRLIAPDLFPSARTYKNNDVHAGAGSKASGFHSLKKEPLTDADLENESYVAGLSVSITTSYILQEMDLHRNNLSKTGLRIDGDELLWPILSKYKFSETYDPVLAYKKLNINFPVNEEDIVHLPNISYRPYYWVTQSNSFLFGTIIPDNAYTPADIERFKRLEQHPVFVYHKYKTLLKFILTTPSMYRNLAVAHVTSVSIKNDVVDHMSKRLQAFRDTLINIAEFREFLRVDGFKALTEILGEFDKSNAKLSTRVENLSAELLKNPDDKKLKCKLEDTRNRIVNSNEISDRYDDILRKCENKSVYSLSLHNNEREAELVFSARPN